MKEQNSGKIKLNRKIRFYSSFPGMAVPQITLPWLSDFFLLGASIIWGCTYILVKQVVSVHPTFSFLTLRFGLAAFCLALMCIPRLNRLSLQTLFHGTILGTFLFLTFAFQTLGLIYTGASVTAFISSLFVVFVPILSFFLPGKKPSGFSVLGICIAVFGLYYMTMTGGQMMDKGVILVLLCSVTCSFHIIATDVFSRQNDILLLTFIQIVFIFILSLAISLVFEPVTIPGVWDRQLVLCVILTGIFATVITFWIIMGFQKNTTPTKAALIYTMEPVSSVFFSFWIAGEVLLPKEVLGATLIILAVLVSETGGLIREKALSRQTAGLL